MDGSYVLEEAIYIGNTDANRDTHEFP